MNDRELADKVVALGVGCKAEDGKYDTTNWRKSDVTESSITRLCHMFPAQFVSDPRVAMSLMEKCTEGKFALRDDGWVAFMDQHRMSQTYESLPHAIIIAYVKALS